MTLECLPIANPNPTLRALPLKNMALSSSSSSSMASFAFPLSMSSSSVKFIPHHSRQKPLFVASITSPPPKGLGAGISLPQNSRTTNLSALSFAASRDESEPSDAEIDMENNGVENPGKESQEAWEHTLAAFKEQALKLQSVSQEAYEVYSRKAAVILNETAEQLKIQADQARKDLTTMAKELSEDGRQYLTAAAENSPESVKDVVQTFASADDLDDVSKVCDFYVGIPYGLILSVGGFLNFMLTGSISALRFGVILGGIISALSVSSLRAWREEKPTEMYTKGQAAIAGILFLRDLGLVFQGSTVFGLLKTIISGAVTTFFMYRIIYDKQLRRPNPNGEEA